MNTNRFLIVFTIFVLVLSACAPAQPVPASQSQTVEVESEVEVTINMVDVSSEHAAPAPADAAAPAEVVPALTEEPIATEPPATEAPAAAEDPYEGVVSLNYDESEGDPLTAGQTKLIAEYLRIEGPISQSDLEAAIVQIQSEAANTEATVYEGTSLTLDQHVSWLVWCSDCTNVDIAADASLVHEITLLADDTVGRVYIQVPFAEGVPLRSDDTWTGADFWAVAVH